MSRKNKEPDQRPEVIRRVFEGWGITVTQDAVLRFMAAVNDPYQAPSREDTRAVAALLWELVQAAKYGQSWEPFKKRLGLRKLRANKFQPDTATIDSPAMGIVCAWLRGTLTRKQAIIEFCERVEHASDSQIRNWINAMRPRAQQLITFEKAILAQRAKK